MEEKESEAEIFLALGLWSISNESYVLFGTNLQKLCCLPSLWLPHWVHVSPHAIGVGTASQVEV